MKHTIASLLFAAFSLAPVMAQETVVEEARKVEVQTDEDGNTVRKVETERTVVPVVPVAPAAGATYEKSIMGRIASSASYSKFKTALEAAGLDQTLTGTGPFTVFVPTNRAFEKMNSQSFDDLLKPENRSLLVSLLQRHIIPQQVKGEEFKTGEYMTSGSELIHVKVESGKITIGQASVTMSNDIAGNGLMHVVDGVITAPVTAPR
ncbi:fasciclin domain-containing protein [Luteolibacter sp. GHJ8]|uniref:Fasciclin domain-containing protein n=1 Tax=Luteolibacter rhizosphaerae TaxID=2989719 RepID=A0ABT3G8Y7_9BACT|nr:fasciclin domain-containing protein [Luteolibacter rhizosphaerae]MCW1916318.1 fasciclin domain-containing protein [Luteolibacter rhizosphaerae]